MRRLVTAVLILVATTALAGSTAMVATAAPPKPTKITLNAKTKNLTVGQKFTARVKSVKPARARAKVKWTSSRKSVATVTGRGLVRAVGAGTAMITARSVVRPRIKQSIRVTVRKAAVVIDPKLLGTWGLFITGAGSTETFKADGTWISVVVFEAPLLPYQQISKGDYQARNGQIRYSNITFQSRKNDDEPWSAWKPAAEPNRIDNYTVGVDEFGEYLATEEAPNQVTPESARYRRSE